MLHQDDDVWSASIALSDDASAFLRGLADIQREGRAVGEGEIRQTLAALCREPRSAGDAGERGTAAAAPGGHFREGHDDEYEALVRIDCLARQGWDDEEAREAMPDLARFSSCSAVLLR